MNKEVCFLKDEIIKFDRNRIEEMKYKAGENSSGKFRYCLHENENAGMQEMLFVISNTGYARPHMHKESAESQVVIEGEGYCVLFDTAGNVTESFKISPRENFIYRIQKGKRHMTLPLSNQMIIYEVREGKFTDSTNIFPEWAPNEDEIEEVNEYKENLLRQLGGV